MRRFGIYSPTLGEREDFPWIFLNKAITKDNSYVQLWDGEIRKSKMRTPELTRTFHAITATSGNTITINGNLTAHYGNGATITIYGSDDNYENLTLSTTSTYNTTSTILTCTTNITLTSTSADYVFNSVDVNVVDPSSKDFRKVAFTDGNPALRYESLVLSSGTERLVGFTKDHIYYWDGNLTRWQLIFTCASSCTYWDATKYGDNLCATNNVDRPVYWDGNTANTFEDIDTRYTSTSADHIAKASFIGEYHNYLFLGNVELQNGTRLQSHAYYSTIGEGLTDGGWIQGGGGDAGAQYISGNGEITGGFGKWRGYLCVFKRQSIRKLWYVALSVPHEQSELSPDIGCLAPGSVVNGPDDDLYFYGTDLAIHGMTAGNVSQPIDKTVRDITPSLLEGIRAFSVNDYKEIRWAIPYGSSAVANNKVVVYKPAEQRWDTDMDIAVTAFGKYTQQVAYTWDTLPYASWDEWGWDSWDSIQGASNYPVDICSDAAGYTYALHGGYQDDGADYESSFVLSTDLADKKALTQNKRITQMFVYVEKEGAGTLSLSAKRDNEASWQSLGSVSLSGTPQILRQRLAVDITAFHFLIKVSGTSKYRFLGMEFEFNYVGAR
jgi:hypothetical protein